MKKTLIICGHPKLSHSTANRLIIENLINRPGIMVCDIQTKYPNGDIDVAAEQDRLREADLIVLQFPFVWYGMPSHMKAWVEKVFSYGFAFGPGGHALKDRKLLLSITLGGSSEAYSPEGQHQYAVETFLLPLQLFAKYCGMQCLAPIYSYEMAIIPGVNEEIIEEKAKLHALKLQRVIESHKESESLAAFSFVK
ncbi:MAG TPA: NAD(P)H-dependent oxidoreductase [Flavisolibacter sp.]|nr:NAD(P)H-dependent oxidoreductase [Flavisolibacter sp.]